MSVKKNRNMAQALITYDFQSPSTSHGQCGNTVANHKYKILLNYLLMGGRESKAERNELCLW